MASAIVASRSPSCRVMTIERGTGLNGSYPVLPSPMPDHAATEAELRGSGIAFTSLRNESGRPQP